MTPREIRISVSNTLSRTFDSVSPTITLSSVASDPTNIAPISVTVTLSESATDFTAGDIVTTNATVANFAGSGTSYTFDLTPSGQGTIQAAVSAGAFHDAADNANTASNTLSRLYDSVGPTVTLSSIAPDPTNTSPIPVTVTLNESSSDFSAGDISTTNATVANFAGSGTSYTFDLVPLGREQFLRLSRPGLA